MIRFKASLDAIGLWNIIRLPKNVSRELPSRGITLVEGTINDTPFRAVLEPDGEGSHWFRIDDDLQENAQVSAGESPELAIEPSKNWPEPTIPSDLQDALNENSGAGAQWSEITTMARWDWIRWIRSTREANTRRRRIKAACDKLVNGERRPCCFNRSQCSEPEVSKAGILLKPNEKTS